MYCWLMRPVESMDMFHKHTTPVSDTSFGTVHAILKYSWHRVAMVWPCNLYYSTQPGQCCLGSSQQNPVLSWALVLWTIGTIPFPNHDTDSTHTYEFRTRF